MLQRLHLTVVSDSFFFYKEANRIEKLKDNNIQNWYLINKGSSKNKLMNERTKKKCRKEKIV